MHTLLAQIQIRNHFQARVQTRSDISDGVGAIRRAKAESGWPTRAPARRRRRDGAGALLSSLAIGSAAAYVAHR